MLGLVPFVSLLAQILAHGLDLAPGAGLDLAGGAGSVHGGCITAVSLMPSDAEGESQVFEARYGHCEGAAAFRVVQLWVGDEVAETAMRLNLGYEAGAMFIEGGGSCAPGDALVLTSTYGSLDCAGSTVQLAGNEMIVHWALAFDVDAFAGTHGLFFDAKGGTGDPEPRLEWTQMGTFTVAPASATSGGETGIATTSGPADTSGASDEESTGDPTTSGTSTTGLGGLPGAPPQRSSGDSGCGCDATAGPASALWLALVGLFQLGLFRLWPFWSRVWFRFWGGDERRRR